MIQHLYSFVFPISCFYNPDFPPDTEQINLMFLMQTAKYIYIHIKINKTFNLTSQRLESKHNSHTYQLYVFAFAFI